MAATAIDIQGVCKRFTLPRPIDQILRHPWQRQRIEVLQGVTLAVQRGTITGLLGPNGAGKTTLLRILAATVLPDSGRVHILGTDAIHNPMQIRRRIGFVLADERSFFWRLTARHNLEFFATLCNLRRREASLRIEEVAEMLDLQDELGKPFRDLSSGMRQRLAFARSLLHDPEVLLVDEPTRAMDPGAAHNTRRIIRGELVETLGKTVLLATHQVDEARALCDRVAFLKQGRILIEDQRDKALERLAEIFAMDERPQFVSSDSLWMEP
jgi:ABC-2 type transport system ATP-binding protein